MADPLLVAWTVGFFLLVVVPVLYLTYVGHREDEEPAEPPAESDDPA